jgi:hypothetical protein
LDEEAEESQSDCIDAMIEKDGIFLSIVMILECWELALFLGLAGK